MGTKSTDAKARRAAAYVAANVHHGEDEGDGLATWCRIMQVGPPCPRPCAECRPHSTTALSTRREDRSHA